MKAPQDIVIRPIITERSMKGIGAGKYTFEVAKDANKIEIAEAVHKIFSVDVTKVNTLRVKGKAKRVGRFPEGKTPDWKKAYVTLKPGQRIDIFEGA